jgi:hypothetical protein
MADNSVPANPLTIGQSQATTWSPATLNAKAASDAAFADSKDAYAAWAAAGKPESGPEKQAVVDALNTSQAAQQATVNAMNNDPQDTPVAPPNAGQIAKDDGPTTNSSPGAGAGTTNNAATSVGADDNPGASKTTAQQVINQAFGTATNSRIITQPNVLDQYASYTYSISWYLLSPAQYNSLYTSMKVNTVGWQLLMQSGGIPVGNRNQFFPVDYYMDDLEIESVVPLHGTNMINSATDLKWKVTEPNGITLIEQLYKAVKSVTPSTPNPNYLTAQHCLVIQFYGYDSQGNLVAPATGQTTTTGNNTNPKSVIQKYYPCVVTDIKFRVANKAIEYSVSAKPLVHFYNASTDRGTIPFAFSLSGQTVAQLLVGGTVSAADIAQFEPGARQESPTPSSASIPPSAPAVPGSRDALATSILSGGSVQVTEDGQYSVGYATGA